MRTRTNVSDFKSHKIGAITALRGSVALWLCAGDENVSCVVITDQWCAVSQTHRDVEGRGVLAARRSASDVKRNKLELIILLAPRKRTVLGV